MEQLAGRSSRRVDTLLIGGGVASVRCARALRRHAFDRSILIVGDELTAPYNRPPLSKELLRDDLPDELVLAEAPSWYERRNIELLTGASVAALDAAERHARLDGGPIVEFEHCLIATGAEPRLLPIPGGDDALILRTLADSRGLRSAAVSAGPGAPVTIIGGGFIGVEVASALAASGLRPTIVEIADRLWGGMLGTELAHWGRERLEAVGVRLSLGAAATRLDADAAWLGDERHEHAFAVAGIGVRPRTALAESAGLAVDDGVVVDGEQRTSVEGIWAAGDVARVAGTRVEHWHAAREQGERAALSMLGLSLDPPRPAWVFSEVAGVALDVIGAAGIGATEQWVREGSVLAWTEGARTVQLAVIGSALSSDEARELVGSGASLSEVEARLG